MLVAPSPVPSVVDVPSPDDPSPDASSSDDPSSDAPSSDEAPSAADYVYYNNNDLKIVS